MKSAVVLLSAGVLAVAHAATCDYAVVAPNLHSLGKPIASCMTATGNSYNLARATAPPTAEQAAAICSKCPEFVAAVAALPPWPDCTMNVGGSEQTLTSYFDKMVGGCKAAGSGAGTTTDAPAATTVAPVVEATTAGSGGSKSEEGEMPNGNNGTVSNEVTAAPANASTTVPTATKSAGYSVHVGAAAATAFAATMAIVF